MKLHPRLPATVLATLAICAAAQAQAADPAAAPHPKKIQLIDTARPGGFFGYWGEDLFVDQKAAERFGVPAQGDVRLARVGVWLMNNSDSEQADVTLSIQTDALDEGGDRSMPSGNVIESWTAPVGTFGWNPVEQHFASLHHPRLLAGHDYWMVAESNAQAGADPIWVFAKKGTQFACVSDPVGGWQACGDGAAPTLRVDAWPAR